MYCTLNRTHLFHLAILLFLSLQPVSSRDLVINEVMASNATTISDEDGDFEDWIELYSYGSKPINLEGYGLSDDYGNPSRWIFPSIVIEPGQFLMVWASGKDRSKIGAPLHTNFRISSRGEEIILTDPSGIIIDEIPPTSIPTDISYGRFPDGSDELFYYKNATPGQPNSETSYSGILGPVMLSDKPGFYSDTIWLELSHPDPEVVIYYTLDGSIPDKNSTEYTSPIRITDRSEEDNRHSMIPTNFITHWRGWKEPAGKVAKSTILRTVALKPDYLSSRVRSATYFVFPEKSDRYSLDVVSLITDSDNFFSDSIGIYVPGNKYSEGQQGTGNYIERGIEWERPASIEFFSDDLAFQQDIGVRIHGGWTRRDPIKSLRLYARNEYSESRFNHQIFPDLPYTSYNRLLLRQSGNDWAETMFRDAAAHYLTSHLDLDIMAYRPKIVFINGEYWGIKNLRERYDRHYLERVYGVNPLNIDLLTSQGPGITIKEGDSDHYDEMIKYITSNDMSDDSLFLKIPEMMDINNFLDYFAAQIYFGNTDWPQNNIDFWRMKVDYDPNALKGHDGRWRWLLFDVDRSFGLFTANDVDMIKHVTMQYNNGREWPNLLLRNLLENESFTYSFINRIADQLNTAFIPSRVHSVIDSFSKLIEPEIEEFIHRWRYPSSNNHWKSNVQSMHNHATHRPDYVRQHVMDHFEIENMINLSVTTDSLNHGHSRVNSIKITPDTPGVPHDPFQWTGRYFHGIPVEIEAIAKEGYSFSHWTGTGISIENKNDRILKLTPKEDIDIKAHFTYTVIPDLISYWFFGSDLPNNTPLETILPTFSRRTNSIIEFRSALEGYPFDENHEYWRTASLERRNAPTEFNYLPEANDDIIYEDSDMRGIQVRQPLAGNKNESELIFHLPTDGYQNIEFRFAAMNEGAAEKLIIDYSVNDGEADWSSELINNIFDLSQAYRLFLIDLSPIDEANNNPDLKLRIRFYADNMTVSEGNRITFNNFSLHGFPLDEIVFSNKTRAEDCFNVKIFPNPATDILRVEFTEDIKHPAIISLFTINGSMVMERTLAPGNHTGGSINLARVEPGLYFLRIIYGQHKIYKTVVIM